MKTERSIVFVSERLPLIWRAEASSRDLSPQLFSDDFGSLNSVSRSKARAFVTMVQMPSSNPRERRHLLNALNFAKAALDRGILPVVVVQGTNGDWESALADIEGVFPNRGIGKDDRFRPLAFHLGSIKAKRVMQRVAAHSPGRPDSRARLKAVEAASKLHADDRILLRRAFGDYDLINYKTLRKRHNCYVYRVQASRNKSSSPIFFLVKTLPYSEIDSEVGIISNSIPKSTPFANVPPLILDRCVSTSSRSALVAQFVDRAILFSDYIERHSPAVAIAALFDGPMRCWRSASRVENRNIAKYALPMIAPAGALPYRLAYERATKLYGALRAPEKLLDDLRSYGSLRVEVCFSHCDLHLENIFVRDGSSEVVLIDFARSQDAPASRDPAELDAALAFSTAESREGTALDDDLLKLLFKPPILSPGVSCRTQSRRALAIEQVRRQTIGSCSETEYRVMLACHCLWWAKHGNPHAYYAAESLV